MISIPRHHAEWLSLVETSGPFLSLPVLLKDGVLWIAIDDPLKTFVADNLSFLAGCSVQCALMPPI